MIYLLTFNLSTFLVALQNVFKSKLMKKLLSIVSAIILIIVLGFRYYVGTDYGSYVLIFNNISVLNFQELLAYQDTEIGHNIVCKIVSDLGFDYKILFLVYAILTVYFLYRIMSKMKLNKFIFISTFIFMILPYSFNIMRQVLAIVLVMYSFIHLFENKNIKSLLLLVLAIMFHKPAIILIPIYLCHLFIKNKKMRNVLMIIIYSLVVLLFLSNVLNLVNIDALSRYTSYLDMEEFDYKLIFTTIIKQIPIILIFYLFRQEFKEDNKDNYTYIAIFIIGFIFLVLGAVNPTLNRLSLYFTAFNSIIIGKALNRKNITIVKLLFYIYLVIYFLYQFYYSGICEIFPYRTWIGELWNN